MSFSTIIFGLVFVIPMIFFFFYFIVWKDAKTRKIGVAVLAALVIFAVIVAYFVNKDK
ncbi:hypothetical protein [Desertivirga arenae]|uniref:hypothetical protein n=1 Tax=Desertivirga arenae TaxID=2810309 RepID=UPI001A95CCC9|nr:hypothetical protein [Pedobacter sp. SYSU D00823]